MSKTKKLCYLGMLTALYVVLSAFLKVTFIGNIQLDLGYIAYAVALYMFGWAGIVVGVVGCSLESILFSAYGFSVSWAAANLVIGVLFVPIIVLNKEIRWPRVIEALAIIGCVSIAMVWVKTPIECWLYGIPFKIKMAKNFVAAFADGITMILGAGIWHAVLYHRVKGMA